MNYRHGFKKKAETKAEYTAWRNAKQRCYNPKHHHFKDYGGRGIIVCVRWKDSFETFLLDMGRKPSPEHSLDRIENDGPYTPSNCRWATRSEQCLNRRKMKTIQAFSTEELIRELERRNGIQR